jgi:hypothetical protein
LRVAFLEWHEDHLVAGGGLRFKDPCWPMKAPPAWRWRADRHCQQQIFAHGTFPTTSPVQCRAAWTVLSLRKNFA